MHHCQLEIRGYLEDGQEVQESTTVAFLTELLARMREGLSLDCRSFALWDEDRDKVLATERNIRKAVAAALVESGYEIGDSYLTLTGGRFGLHMRLVRTVELDGQ